MSDPDAPPIDLLEAETRRHMAAHAAIPPRGWDAQRQRTHLHRIIDECLDAWLLENAYSA